MKRRGSLNSLATILLVSVLALLSAGGGCDLFFSNTSAGGWTRHTIDDSRSGADGVKLGDADGDGLTDLVVPWEEGGVVVVYLNPGPARAKTSWPSVQVGQVEHAEDAVFVDLDDDGRLDVVSSCEGDVKSMYVHWGPAAVGNVNNPDRWETAVLPATQNERQWMFCEPADIDGRDGVDLVAGAKGDDGAIGVLLAPANPRQLAGWRWVRLADAVWIMSIIPYDMDADGDTDILYSDRKDSGRGCYWLENPGGAAAALGLWLRHTIGTASDELMFMDLGDLDDDGRLDIVVATDARQLIHFASLSNPRLPWLPRPISRTDEFGTGKGVRIADLDLDGVKDLAFSCENAGGRGGMGLFSKRSAEALLWTTRSLGEKSGKKFDLIQTLDVDADGDLDLITTEEAEGLGVVWYENPAIP